MLKDLAEIAAVNPAISGGAPNEMVGFVHRRSAKRIADVFAARDIGPDALTSAA
jgi:hypothetical protein